VQAAMADTIQTVVQVAPLAKDLAVVEVQQVKMLVVAVVAQPDLELLEFLDKEVLAALDYNLALAAYQHTMQVVVAAAKEHQQVPADLVVVVQVLLVIITPLLEQQIQAAVVVEQEILLIRQTWYQVPAVQELY
jgi:hypothetical protein